MPAIRALLFSAGIALLTLVADGQDPQLVPLGRQQGRPGLGKPVPPGEAAVSDGDALKSAGLSEDDGAKLVEYLKQRTLTDADQGKIAGIIKRFAADDFEDREKAAKEIEIYGPAAIGPLKTAERDGDPEVAYRAKLVSKKMSKVPHSAVASATVRAIARTKPAGATAALIGFLPLADDETIADAIRDALVELAVKDGRADPALIDALNDPSPVRRSAAYRALILGGPPGERIRIPDAYKKVRDAILKDGDPEAKFIGLWTLLLTTKEAENIPELIGLIPQAARGRLWQVEDLLLQLAGTHPKEGRFLKSKEALTRARDVWLEWWKEKGKGIDFVKFDFKPRVLGMTDAIERDYRGYNQGRIVSFGPDLKEKWRISNVNNPTDMLVVPNDRVIVVESNTNQVTERTTNGTILKQKNVLLQPLNIQKTAEGGLLIVCRNRIVEFDKNWAESPNTYTRASYDIMGGLRLPKGDTLFVTNSIQGANCIRLDSKLKEGMKTYTFGRIQNLQAMDVVDDEKILVCEFDRVAEYDLSNGKQIWKYECVAPSSCQRLLNGNTLIALLNSNRLVEVDPSGEIVWDYQAKDGLRVALARRR